MAAGVLCLRLTPHLRGALEAEASDRGVELSALVRAVLRLHVDEVALDRLGWTAGDEVVIQIHRRPYVELTIHRRSIRED